MITGKFNNFIRYQGLLYTIRSFKAIYPIAYEIKKLFNLQYLPNSFSCEIDNKKYWLEQAKQCQDGNIYESFPLKDFYNRDDKFNEELKRIIFFRYVMGFICNGGSIRVGFDGIEYIPFSYKEGKIYNQPKTGKMYKITANKSLPGETIIRINPNQQLKLIFKSQHVKYENILFLIEKIKNIIVKYDIKQYNLIFGI